MRCKINGILKFLFPVIFAGYIGMISFYTHVHVVNGTTVVHSHPFHKNTEGRSSHSHTPIEFRLIQVLTSFSLTAEVVPHFQFAPFIFFLVAKAGKPVTCIVPAGDAGVKGCRAPPFLF